jgi:hypothetical protein
MGSSAIFSDGKVVDVDLNGLVRRLLLFDRYVLMSVRLQEFPALARRIGFGALRDLLDTKLIEIRCECLQLAQIGQSAIFGDPVLPPLSYKFNWLEMHDREKYIHDCLQPMHESSGLRHKEVLRLKRSIIEAIKPLPTEIKPTLFPPFRNELLNNAPFLTKSIEFVIRNFKHRELVPFTIRVHEEAKDTYVVETDLSERLQIDQSETHNVVESGMLGLASLTQAIGEMRAFSAISGFRDDELPLFRQKLDILADAVSSSSREISFQRLLTIAGIPEFPDDKTLNIEKLLKVRESSETREFSDLLANIGSATDAEIHDRVSGFKNAAALFLTRPSVKKMKVLALAAAGLVPHAAIPVTALGLLDAFLLERLLPRSGIAAFVNELYPSMFEKKEPETNDRKIDDQNHVLQAKAS